MFRFIVRVVRRIIWTTGCGLHGLVPLLFWTPLLLEAVYILAHRDGVQNWAHADQSNGGMGKRGFPSSKRLADR